MKTNIINLENYRTLLGNVKSKVFTGRDRGLDVREKSHIDELFNECEKVKFVIPNDIFSITPSFLEELFFNVVKVYGKEKLYEKLDLEGNIYDLHEPLNEAIDRILQRKTGLDK